MYLEHFGLRDKPFALACELSRYYPAAHQEAQNDLLYSIEERQGVAALVGEPGTGKTTLLKNMLRLLGPDIHGVLVPDVSLSGVGLLTQVLVALDFSETQNTSPGVLQRSLQDFKARGRVVVLMVDEAQALSDRQFHEVQYLSNLEEGNEKLVQLILSGQPGLESRLDEPSFEALSQRVAVRTHINPLSLEQTRAYVELRLQTSGCRNPGLFPFESLVRLHKLSGGIPRLINLIGERTLLIGYADDLAIITARAVEQAADELQLLRTSTARADLPQSSTPLEQKLHVIEQKIDLLLRAMRGAGLAGLEPAEPPRRSNPSALPQSEAAAARKESEADRPNGIVSDFSARTGST